MNRTTKLIVSVALAVIIGAAGFIGGFAIAHLDYFTPYPAALAAVGAPASSGKVGSKVDEINALLQSKALEPPNEASATAGAIQGLLSSNGDKYATYFNATHYKAFNEETMGSFGGIGVVLGENKQGQAYVVEVYKDTPADKVGMKSGDVFMSIDGSSNAKWTTDEVVKRVRGKEGTQVKLIMTRPGKNGAASTEVPLTITRAVINYPNTKTKMYGNIGYVRLGQFNANSHKDMTKAIEDLTKQGAKGIVFDLRDDPGGLLDQAVDVSSLFIKDGAIVRVDERGKPEKVYQATGGKITDLPMVVLINGNSASASEIAAGALQDYGRATLVGEKSFGKGSVQTIEPLGDGAAIKFTIAHYLTPKSRAINGIGLTPDVVVVMDPSKEMDAKTDTQLNKALEVLKGKIK
jgi:carboxyl-terminal processing protease